MDELASLTKTANGEVLTSLTQKRERVHPATYIGKRESRRIKSSCGGIGSEVSHF